MTEDQLEASLHRIFSDPNLRAFVLDLARRCGYGTTPFTPNALQSAFAAGRLSIINELVQLFNETDPAFWPGLLEEENRDRRDQDRD